MRFGKKIIFLVIVLAIFSLGIHTFYIPHIHPGEHTPAVQTALYNEGRKLLLLLAVSFFIFGLYKVPYVRIHVQHSNIISLAVPKYFQKDSLKEAFRRGILNTKLCG